MAVGGIQNHHVDLGLNQSFNTIQHVGRDAHRRAAEQASLLVLGGQRVLDLLLNIFNGDQAL